MWGLQQPLIFDWSEHGRVASLHFFPHYSSKIKFFKSNTILSRSFPLFLCVKMPLKALPTWYGIRATSDMNMKGYTCVEMLSYRTVRFLLFWVIVTQPLIVQEPESQSAIRNRHQRLLLIKQRLNATAVPKPQNSPWLVNLCLPPEVSGD